MRRVVVALILAAAVSACALNRSPQDKVDKLKPGMTEEEVRAIMGPPYNITAVGSWELWTWVWRTPHTHFAHSATFVDGKMIEERGRKPQ